MIEHWYLKPWPIILPIEYYFIRIYGWKSFNFFFVHFIVCIYPIIGYYFEKFHKDIFLTMYLQQNSLRDSR